MNTATPKTPATNQLSLQRQHFEVLLKSIERLGYTIIAPTFKDGTIVLDEIHSIADLPIGWAEEEQAGKYRVTKRSDDALFSFTVSANSWKRFLHPPIVKLWHTKRNRSMFEISQEGNGKPPKLALLGVRPCDLRAIEILDTVFQKGPYTDPAFHARRSNILTIVVNCTQPGGTCFCASMGTGPKATSGFDLALTEVIGHDRHFFAINVGSERGRELLNNVPHETLPKEDAALVEQLIADATDRMGRSVITEQIGEILNRNTEHPRWSNVAQRCLTCANCTMVCPTCFCTTIEDTSDLTGQTAGRVRKSDSCFSLDFSYIHGGYVRSSVSARYRQWLMHKFASWQQQFGSFGCVGCGRCITWCPVGIDITEELRAIRETDKQPLDVLDTQSSSTAIKE